MEIALKVFAVIVGIVCASAYIYVFADVFKEIIQDFKEGKEDE